MAENIAQPAPDKAGVYETVGGEAFAPENLTEKATQTLLRKWVSDASAIEKDVFDVLYRLVAAYFLSIERYKLTGAEKSLLTNAGLLSTPDSTGQSGKLLTSLPSGEVAFSHLIARYASCRSLLEEKALMASCIDVPQQIKTMLLAGLNHSQQDAVKRAWDNAGSLITGGAGTGKTTVATRIALGLSVGALSAERNFNLNGVIRPCVGAVAFTAKAALLLHSRYEMELQKYRQSGGEGIGDFAELGFVGTVAKLLRNPRLLQNLDYLIVDESSMVSLDHFLKLLGSLAPKVGFVLIGDSNQLPPVGLGRPFHHLIQSYRSGGEAHNLMTTLEKPERYDAKGNLPRLHALLEAADEDAVVSEFRTNKSVQWIELNPEQELSSNLFTPYLSHWFEVIDKLQVSHSGGVSEAEIQGQVLDFLAVSANEVRLISSRRTGSWGVSAINAGIQQLLLQRGTLQPAATHLKPAFSPIIARVNDYERGVLNGLTGMLIPSGEPDRNEMIGLFSTDSPKPESSDKTSVRVRWTGMQDWDLNWAITVHQAQGSEYPHVIVILGSEAKTVRSDIAMLYTAVTRAQSKLTLVASEEVLRLHLKGRESQSL